MSGSGEALIRARGLEKTYGAGETVVHALRDATFEVPRGEVVVLLGASGSGKTTLLNTVGAIEPLTAGELSVDGIDVTALDDDAATDYRRERVGFVFQFYNLVPTLTAMENVQLVAELTGPDASDRSRATLADVGLADRVDHYPGQLSGGEQQRVAIARALVKEPRLVLADEPTGALDLETGRQVLALLQHVTREHAHTVLIVTHNSAIARMADRVLRMRDGSIVADERNDAPLDAAAVSW